MQLIEKIVLWLRVLFGFRPTWRDYLRAGLPLPDISGGAGETKTTVANLLKEYYPSGGIVNAVNVDTFLLDKVERAKKFTMVG